MKSNEMGIKDGFLTIGKVCKTAIFCSTPGQLGVHNRRMRYSLRQSTNSVSVIFAAMAGGRPDNVLQDTPHRKIMR